MNGQYENPMGPGPTMALLHLDRVSVVNGNIVAEYAGTFGQWQDDPTHRDSGYFDPSSVQVAVTVRSSREGFIEKFPLQLVLTLGLSPYYDESSSDSQEILRNFLSAHDD